MLSTVGEDVLNNYVKEYFSMVKNLIAYVSQVLLMLRMMQRDYLQHLDKRPENFSTR